MSWQSTHATLTRNMQKSPTCTAVGQAFLFPTRTYPSQGLNLKQAAEGADNMSHRTCPIGPMAPGIKDSSPRAGGWDKNYKLATAASNAMGRAPSHPPRTCMLRRDEEEFNNGSSGKMVSKLTHDRSHNPCPKPIKSY